MNSLHSQDYDDQDLDFLDAINSDEIPRPTKKWRSPTLAEVESCVDLTRKITPEALELEEICKNTLGFYLFCKYLKDHGDMVYANFLYDVASSKTTLKTRVGDVLRIVIMNFLLPSSHGHVQARTMSPSVYRIPGASLAANSQPTVVKNVGGGDADASQEIAGNVLGISGELLSNVLQHFHRPSSEEPLAHDIDARDHGPLQQAMDAVETEIFARMRKKHQEGFKQSHLYRTYFDFHVLLKEKISEDDFTLFRVLGRGGFGIVNGCKHRQSGKLYAMKVLHRKRLKSLMSYDVCLMERNLLASLDTPFVTSLAFAFQSPTELFLIMELMTGGDLKYHLHRKGRFNSHEAKYFAARALLGLQAIHNMSVVYRDLKPDNILMAADGSTKLSDFGLAATITRKGLTGSCGTRGYLAPDMMQRDENGKRVPYGLSVDWFSFGCMLYEFYTGVSPFLTEVATNWGGLGRSNGDQSKAIDLATVEMDPFFDPEIFDEVTQDICSKLLVKDGKARLGAHGAGEVMSHAFFDEIEWSDIEREAVRPPFIPRKDVNTQSQVSIGQFHIGRDIEKVELSRADYDFFDKWDFVRPQPFFEEAVMYLQAEEQYGPLEEKSAKSGFARCICC